MNLKSFEKWISVGYYCTLGSEEPAPVGKSYGDICPAGYYCNNGTHTPAACPPGTYLNSTGMGDINDCLQCSPGKLSASASFQGIASIPSNLPKVNLHLCILICPVDTMSFMNFGHIKSRKLID